ncbi:MAG: sodium:solute symporter family transporter, partial [Phycisphaeraceae bacterium]
VPYTSDQAVVQRYLTTRDTRSAAGALWLSAVGGLPIQVLFYTVGTAMFVFYQAHPDMLPAVAVDDAIVPVFLIQQLPVGLTGVVLAGVFAAGMSTIDSSMNSIATAVVSDFYQPFARRDNERTRMRLARAATLIVGLLGTFGAMAVATRQDTSLLDTFLGWLFLVMGIVAGLFTLGIITTRANWIGALIGALAAASTVASLKLYSPLNGFLYSVVGLITCVAVGYFASRLLSVPQHDLAGLTLHTRQPYPRAPFRTSPPPPPGN